MDKGVSRSFPCLIFLSFVATLLGACNGDHGSGQSGIALSGTPCVFEQKGWGAPGSVPLKADKVITGLEVPWAIAFLPGGDWLVTERAGRIRLVRDGKLVSAPVASVSVGESGEGGLLGIAASPQFASNRQFFVYYTTNLMGGAVNRVERYQLSSDHASAASLGVILDQIPASTFHDGGRIKFGPDGKLYVGVGDARSPDSAQDPGSLNGKILRINEDGSIPADNPRPGSAIFASGVRNPEAFDWVSASLLLIADHGPTGELGLTGRDEISFASSGSNLGWPLISACETRAGLINPILSFSQAAPPGGAVVYHGTAIPEFDGDFLVGMLGIGDGSAMQLHRLVFDARSQTLVRHETYFQGEWGRLRDIEQAPDGALYVTTSNCDGRGVCPADGDAILRISHQ